MNLEKIWTMRYRNRLQIFESLVTCDESREQAQCRQWCIDNQYQFISVKQAVMDLREKKPEAPKAIEQPKPANLSGVRY